MSAGVSDSGTTTMSEVQIGVIISSVLFVMFLIALGFYCCSNKYKKKIQHVYCDGGLNYEVDTKNAVSKKSKWYLASIHCDDKSDETQA